MTEIPEWLTEEEAIEYIMAHEQCSWEEAEALLDEFYQGSPWSFASGALN